MVDGLGKIILDDDDLEGGAPAGEWGRGKPKNDDPMSWWFAYLNDVEIEEYERLKALRKAVQSGQELSLQEIEELSLADSLDLFSFPDGVAPPATPDGPLIVLPPFASTVGIKEPLTITKTSIEASFDPESFDVGDDKLENAQFAMAMAMAAAAAANPKMRAKGIKIEADNPETVKLLVLAAQLHGLKVNKPRNLMTPELRNELLSKYGSHANNYAQSVTQVAPQLKQNRANKEKPAAGAGASAEDENGSDLSGEENDDNQAAIDDIPLPDIDNENKLELDDALKAFLIGEYGRKAAETMFQEFDGADENTKQQMLANFNAERLDRELLEKVGISENNAKKVQDEVLESFEDDEAKFTQGDIKSLLQSEAGVADPSDEQSLAMTDILKNRNVLEDSPDNDGTLSITDAAKTATLFEKEGFYKEGEPTELAQNVWANYVSDFDAENPYFDEDILSKAYEDLDITDASDRQKKAGETFINQILGQGPDADGKTKLGVNPQTQTAAIRARLGLTEQAPTLIHQKLAEAYNPDTDEDVVLSKEDITNVLSDVGVKFKDDGTEETAYVTKLLGLSGLVSETDTPGEYKVQINPANKAQAFMAREGLTVNDLPPVLEAIEADFDPENDVYDAQRIQDLTKPLEGDDFTEAQAKAALNAIEKLGYFEKDESGVFKVGESSPIRINKALNDADVSPQAFRMLAQFVPILASQDEEGLNAEKIKPMLQQFGGIEEPTDEQANAILGAMEAQGILQKPDENGFRKLVTPGEDEPAENDAQNDSSGGGDEDKTEQPDDLEYTDEAMKRIDPVLAAVGLSRDNLEDIYTALIDDDPDNESYDEQRIKDIAASVEQNDLSDEQAQAVLKAMTEIGDLTPQDDGTYVLSDNSGVRIDRVLDSADIDEDTYDAVIGAVDSMLTENPDGIDAVNVTTLLNARDDAAATTEAQANAILDALEIEGVLSASGAYGLRKSATAKAALEQQQETQELTGEQITEILDKPLGMALTDLGALTEEQTQQSGEVQAKLVALRDAAERGDLDVSKLPEFKGNPDLLGLAEKPDELNDLLEEAGVNDEMIAVAQEQVDSRQGVNSDEQQITVPPMGMIHAKLHTNREISQAALTAQQSVRAAQAALRMVNGETDPSVHETRREFNFDNSRDSEELQAAQATHKELSQVEAEHEAGETVDISPAYLEEIGNSLSAAAQMFENAGFEDVALQVDLAAEHLTRQLREKVGLQADTPNAENDGTAVAGDDRPEPELTDELKALMRTKLYAAEGIGDRSLEVIWGTMDKEEKLALADELEGAASETPEAPEETVDEAPNTDALDLAESFDKPLGLMLKDMEYITQEQADISGEAQAVMLAIRDAVQDESNPLDESDLPSFRDAPDLLALATDNDKASELMDKAGIGDAELNVARETVNSFEGVNSEEDQLKVPPMGMIHTKLHVSRELTQAALAMQQSLRAVKAAERLSTGAADPALHETRREFNFDNSRDEPLVQDATAIHRELSTLEADTMPGSGIDVTAQTARALDVMADAADMFGAADAPEIEDAANRLLKHYEQELEGRGLNSPSDALNEAAAPNDSEAPEADEQQVEDEVVSHNFTEDEIMAEVRTILGNELATDDGAPNDNAIDIVWNSYSDDEQAPYREMAVDHLIAASQLPEIEVADQDAVSMDEMIKENGDDLGSKPIEFDLPELDEDDILDRAKELYAATEVEDGEPPLATSAVNFLWDDLPEGEKQAFLETAAGTLQQEALAALSDDDLAPEDTGHEDISDADSTTNDDDDITFDEQEVTDKAIEIYAADEVEDGEDPLPISTANTLWEDLPDEDKELYRDAARGQLLAESISSSALEDRGLIVANDHDDKKSELARSFDVAAQGERPENADKLTPKMVEELTKAGLDEKQFWKTWHTIIDQDPAEDVVIDADWIRNATSDDGLKKINNEQAEKLLSILNKQGLQAKRNVLSRKMEKGQRHVQSQHIHKIKNSI